MIVSYNHKPARRCEKAITFVYTYCELISQSKKKKKEKKRKRNCVLTSEKNFNNICLTFTIPPAINHKQNSIERTI